VNYEQVPPAAPVAPWLGGKKVLHRAIIARIEAIEHSTYVEPFVGMGGVFLRRKWRPKAEVANDLNGEITNPFRILQRHYPQFLEVMRFQITSRREFERLRACDPATLTDLEHAARFLYLQRLAFGGQINGVFGVASERGARFSLSKLEPLLDAAHERLEGVVFEGLDWKDVIRRYDTPGTLFYLDPPYWGGENDYGKDLFGRDQFAAMAEALANIEGAFILSINDRPEIRELFGSFHMDEVTLRYTVAKSGAKEAQKLIVTNRKVRSTLI
jgi:DNA adenine methylase